MTFNGKLLGYELFNHHESLNMKTTVRWNLHFSVLLLPLAEDKSNHLAEIRLLSIEFVGNNDAHLLLPG